MVTLNEHASNAWVKLEMVGRYKNRSTVTADLSYNEYALFCYISSQMGTATITKIADEDYFLDISFSSIKRYVLKLLDKDLIVSVVSNEDKRVRWLSVK